MPAIFSVYVLLSAGISKFSRHSVLGRGAGCLKTGYCEAKQHAYADQRAVKNNTASLSLPSLFSLSQRARPHAATHVQCCRQLCLVYCSRSRLDAVYGPASLCMRAKIDFWAISASAGASRLEHALEARRQYVPDDARCGQRRSTTARIPRKLPRTIPKNKQKTTSAE